VIGRRDADPLDGLRHEHPAWRAWLALLEAVRPEIDDPRYTAAVPSDPPARAGADDAPLVDGTTFELSRRELDRWLRRLLRSATEAGASESLAAAARAPVFDVPAVVEAAIAADRPRLDALADAVGAERQAFAPVAAVTVMPLLHACARAWSARVSVGWDRGYCPICGAWPALAEARGLERERRLRCTRCGGDWRTEWLRCPHCGNRDHLSLAALVSEATAESRKAETCAACRCYVKTISTLTPTAARDVAMQDLATVDLDVGALAHGYHGPQGLGYPVRVQVKERSRWPPVAWKR
jgi:FdhE protein